MKPFPQISKETGISQDYINAVNPAIMIFNRSKNISKSVRLTAKYLRVHPIWTYEQKYPPKVYAYNDGVKDKIDILDEYVRELNKNFIDEDKFDPIKFKEKINGIYEIIYGKDKKFYK